MRFLFVHAWNGFSLAEWYLRDVLETSSPVPVEFRAYDMPVSGVPIDDTLPRILASWRPDVVGFSCHYWSVGPFLAASRWVKHLCPSAQVVFGGPQVGSEAIAGQILATPTVDYVLRGAVQHTLCQLIGALRDPSAKRAIPGLSYREHGLPRHNPTAETRGRRQGRIFHRGNTALTDVLSTARECSYETVIGCRARCTYCVYPTNKFELIDDDLVESELAYLCSLGVPHIRLCDAHFAGVKDRAKRFLRHLAKVNRASSIKVYPDVRHVDREYVELLRAARAEVTSIGVQTTNPESLTAIKRRPVEEKLEAVQLLLEAFPRTPADIIVGLPHDDVETLERTLRDLVDLGFSRVNAFRLHLFPGTTLGDLPGEHLDMPSVVHTDHGQLLSSRQFPVESAERVASLVHTAEIVLPLVRARRLLAARGKVGRLMDLARELDAGALLDLRTRMAAPFPVVLLRHLEASVATLAAALDGDPELADAIALDLLDHLRACAEERRLRDLQWDAEAQGRRVRVVELRLRSGAVAVWDLPRRELRIEARGAPAHAQDVLSIGGPNDAQEAQARC